MPVQVAFGNSYFDVNDADMRVLLNFLVRITRNHPGEIAKRAFSIWKTALEDSPHNLINLGLDRIVQSQRDGKDLITILEVVRDSIDDDTGLLSVSTLNQLPNTGTFFSKPVAISQFTDIIDRIINLICLAEPKVGPRNRHKER